MSDNDLKGLFIFHSNLNVNNPEFIATRIRQFGLQCKTCFCTCECECGLEMNFNGVELTRFLKYNIG